MSLADAKEKALGRRSMIAEKQWFVSIASQNCLSVWGEGGKTPVI